MAVGGDRGPQAGRNTGVTLIYLVQHGEKQRLPGDPGLTPKGRQQATDTGQWLRGLGVRALYSSPLLRARETAGYIASVTGLAVQLDDRLRERLNWDGNEPFDVFLALWARTTRERGLVPPKGDSSWQAGARMRAFLTDLPSAPGPAAAVTHGGITSDLLRDLLGDNALPGYLLDAGIPPCAVTAVDDLKAVMIASTAHLV